MNQLKFYNMTLHLFMTQAQNDNMPAGTGSIPELREKCLSL